MIQSETAMELRRHDVLALLMPTFSGTKDDYGKDVASIVLTKASLPNLLHCSSNYHLKSEEQLLGAFIRLPCPLWLLSTRTVISLLLTPLCERAARLQG
jgi:hypothetical protein